MRLGAVAAVCLAVAFASQAATITVSASGVIDNVTSSLSSNFAAGQPITISFALDNSIPPFYLASTVAAYPESVKLATSWTSPGYTASGTGGPQALVVQNDHQVSPGDPYVDEWNSGELFLAGSSLGGLNVLYVEVITANVSTPTPGSLLTSLGLTPVPLDPSTSSVFLAFVDPAHGNALTAEVQGHLTSLTQAPEPTSLALFSGLGVIALVGIRSTRRP
jgi:hypothetical protein